MRLWLLHPAAIHFTLAFLLAGAVAELWAALPPAERAGVRRIAPPSAEPLPLV